MINSFSFSGIPKIEFGAEKISLLPKIVNKFGRNLLLITGGTSLKKSGKLESILSDLSKLNINVYSSSVDNEPSPSVVDSIVNNNSANRINSVCAIGGGSVLDAGKAVAAMLIELDSVKTFLEGVGTKTPTGSTLPFIAVPTTSGTGSEATKNAVISEIGPHGFKKSLRHDNYIPDIAILDPELTVSCPQIVTAAGGLDALSQLMESYISTKSTPLTNALAFDGIKKIFKSLIPVCTDQSKNKNHRSNMSYAAFLSGITLAHARLGTVHGLASPLGGVIPAPHGIICGKLLPPWCKYTIKELQNDNSAISVIYLNKFAEISKILNPEINNQPDLLNKLIKTLYYWDRKLCLPKLSECGLTSNMIPEIAEESGNKNNPIAISEDLRSLILLEVL